MVMYILLLFTGLLVLYIVVCPFEYVTIIMYESDV